MVVLLLLCAIARPAAGAGTPAAAVLAGTVVHGSSRAPISGARVRLAGADTRGEVVSAPTDVRGRFTIPTAPTDTYRVTVEHGDARYPADRPVPLAPGSSRSVRIEIAATPSLAPAGVWDNPTTASVIIAGGAILLGFLVREATEDDDSDESPASPSQP